MIAAADEEFAVLVEEFTSGKGLIDDRSWWEYFQALGFTFDRYFSERSRPWIVSADGALQVFSGLRLRLDFVGCRLWVDRLKFSVLRPKRLALGRRVDCEVLHPFR